MMLRTMHHPLHLVKRPRAHSIAPTRATIASITLQATVRERADHAPRAPDEAALIAPASAPRRGPTSAHDHEYLRVLGERRVLLRIA